MFRPDVLRFAYLLGTMSALTVLLWISVFPLSPAHYARLAREEEAYQAAALRRAPIRADSLVLERTRCYGSCPAYRLSVTAAGRVLYQSRNPGDSTVGRDSVPPRVLTMLIARAESAGFFALPRKIGEDQRICPMVASDHPTVTTAIYADSGLRIVEDYLGCFVSADDSRNPVLAKLRAFEVQVDSALRSSRWIRRGGRNGDAAFEGPIGFVVTSRGR